MKPQILCSVWEESAKFINVFGKGGECSEGVERPQNPNLQPAVGILHVPIGSHGHNHDNYV